MGVDFGHVPQYLLFTVFRSNNGAYVEVPNLIFIFSPLRLLLFESLVYHTEH